MTSLESADWISETLRLTKLSDVKYSLRIIKIDTELACAKSNRLQH